MLAKKFRLPVNVFPAKARIFYRGGHFTIKISSNNLSYNRVGVIATKKTAPGAVERNRLRRKIFDLFREETRLRSADSAFVATSAKEAARKSEGELRVAPARQSRDLLVLLKPIKLDRGAEEKLFKELKIAINKI